MTRENKICISPPGGLEPPTFRLTAERASRLRHGGMVINHKGTLLNSIFIIIITRVSKINRVRICVDDKKSNFWINHISIDIFMSFITKTIEIDTDFIFDTKLILLLLMNIGDNCQQKYAKLDFLFD